MQVNSYPETNFKETAIGSIPADWDVAIIEDIGIVSGGGTPSTHNPDYWDGDIAWLTPSDVTAHNSLYIDRSTRYITELGLKESSAKLLPPNTILMTSRATIGEVVICSVPMATNQGFINIIADDSKISSVFLAYWIKWSKQFLTGLGKGTTFLEIAKGVFKKVQIPLPPLLEQQRITAVLNTIQDEIAAQDDIIAEAKEFKRSLMHRLFTYGAGENPAETKETEIGEIPVHWKVTTIGQICEAHGGLVQTGPFGSQLHASDYVDVGIPSVMPQDIVDNRIITTNIAYINDNDHKRLTRYHLHNGDIVYARRGDIGRRALVTEKEDGWLCGTGSLFIRLNAPSIYSPYLHHYLGRAEVTEFIYVRAVGTTMLNLNTEILKSVPVAYPQFDEQYEIAQQLDSVDEKIAVEEDRKAAMQDFFKTTLHQLMSGQIRLLSD